MKYSMNIMPPEDNSAASLGIILLLVHIKSGQTFQPSPLNNAEQS